MEDDQDRRTEAPLCDACRRIPLSYLSLDLDEPLVGWQAYLDERYITVMDDSLGRPSVARYVLGDLIAEQRERETRLAEEAAAKAAALVQPVAIGVPAIEDGDAYASMMSAGSVSPAQEFGGRPAPRFIEEQLEEGAQRQAAEQEAVRRRKEAR